jgi:BlaI family transcriptional regulator, penicillinase repressor
MPRNRVELTGSEWPVMKATWDLEPCTAPAVREKLAKSTGWTYSTVRTLMDRMAAKGLLNAKKEGKLTIYSSAVTRPEAQRGELFYTLKHAFNGAFAPLVQCLLESKDINEDELAKIEALIQAGKNRRKNKNQEKEL